MKIAGKESKEISRVQGRVMKGVMVLLLATGLAGHAQAAPGNGSAVAATVTAPTAATSTPLPAPEITSVAAIPESTPESVLTSASALTSESIPAPMVQPVYGSSTTKAGDGFICLGYVSECGRGC